MEVRKQNHWINHFIKTNTSVLSIIMMIANHIVESFETKQDNDSILAPANNFLLATTNGNGKLEGCYMFYDKEVNKFIRSVKDVGNNRNINERMKEHMKKLKNNSIDSNFNTQYSNNCDKLQSYLALGFERKESTLELLTKDIQKGGIFYWNNNILEQLKKSKSIHVI